MIWPNENQDKNKQIHAIFRPFFKISRTYAWKVTPFSWFRKLTHSIEKKIPLFDENGYEYEHGCTPWSGWGGEGGGWEGWGWGGEWVCKRVLWSFTPSIKIALCMFMYNKLLRHRSDNPWGRMYIIRLCTRIAVFTAERWHPNSWIYVAIWAIRACLAEVNYTTKWFLLPTLVFS